MRLQLAKCDSTREASLVKEITVRGPRRADAIVVPGLTDHLYAKYAPRYENFVDSAILKIDRLPILHFVYYAIFGHF